MEKASKVMYSIANFFTWIVALLAVALIVISGLAMGGVIQNADLDPNVGLPSLIASIILLLICVITIAMVRRAKADGTSKAWDVFFIIMGVLGGNIFYILGGIFGVAARR